MKDLADWLIHMLLNTGRWNVADVNPKWSSAVFTLLESYWLSASVSEQHLLWWSGKTFGILLNLAHPHFPPTLKLRTLQHRDRQIFPLTIALLSNAHSSVRGQSLIYDFPTCVTVKAPVAFPTGEYVTLSNLSLCLPLTIGSEDSNSHALGVRNVF